MSIKKLRAEFLIKKRHYAAIRKDMVSVKIKVSNNDLEYVKRILTLLLHERDDTLTLTFKHVKDDVWRTWCFKYNVDFVKRLQS
jgi:hypothetical protein